jgi:hypothetical protein
MQRRLLVCVTCLGGSGVSVAATAVRCVAAAVCAVPALCPATDVSYKPTLLPSPLALPVGQRLCIHACRRPCPATPGTAAQHRDLFNMSWCCCHEGWWKGCPCGIRTRRYRWVGSVSTAVSASSCLNTTEVRCRGQLPSSSLAAMLSPSTYCCITCIYKVAIGLQQQHHAAGCTYTTAIGP